jgi:hypothetical protein
VPDFNTLQKSEASMRGSVLLIAGIASFAVAGLSIAAPVTQTRIVAFAGDQSQDTTSSHAQSANLPYAFVDDHTSVAAHVAAAIIPGTLLADFSVTAASDNSEHAGAQAYANLELLGQAEIHQLQAIPPGVSAFLPISILAGGSGGINGDLDKAISPYANGSASFDFLINNVFAQHIGDASFLADASHPSGGFQQRFNMSSFALPSGTLTIQAHLHFEGSADIDVVNDTGSIGGQGLVDPQFSFDQAAYDAFAAQNGLPTINLTDYYAFEFSEALVPEPAFAFPAAAVVSFLAALHPRRRRR